MCVKATLFDNRYKRKKSYTMPHIGITKASQGKTPPKRFIVGGDKLSPMSGSSNLIFQHLFWATSFPLAQKNYRIPTQINAK